MSDVSGVHLFTHEGRWYAYDRNVNEVCSVGAAEAALLGGESNAPAGFAVESLRKAAESIAAANGEGLFLQAPPVEIEACDSCHALDEFDSGLSHLTLTITEACDLRCRYCPHTHGGLDWQRGHSARRMPREVLRGALRFFLPRCVGGGNAAVSIYGGEPLLEFDLVRETVELIEAEAPRDDLRVTIDTNGRGLLRPEVRTFVAEHRLHLQVSLDGPAEVHDRHRVAVDGSPTHAGILEGLDELLSLDPSAAERLRIQATVVDAADLEAVDAWFADFPPFRRAGVAGRPSLGANLADLRGVDSGALDLGDDVPASRATHLDAFRRRYLDARTRGETPGPLAAALFDGDLIGFYHRGRGPLAGPVPPAGFCVAGKRRLHVNVDGEFQPCERVGSGLLIGDVERGIDAAASRRLTERFVETMGGRCGSCWASRLCTLCATSLVDGGEIPESVCDSMRAAREDMLGLWADLVEAGGAATKFLEGSQVE